MDAIVILNKPAGMTSFDAVNKCRRILHEKKSGHTGTLDPNASGLLIILFGKYTKYLPYCVHDHKRYAATFELGYRTDTEDVWGEVLETKEPAVHNEEEMNAAVQSLLGDYWQIPPMYSAIKKDGQKLYQLARKGIVIEREPRLCHIYDPVIRRIDDTHWSLEVGVSKGTYIRTLITDIASSLGELASMTSLVRTKIEEIPLENAQTLEQLEQEGVRNISIREIMDPTLKFVEVENPDDAYHGRAMKLSETDDTIIVTYKNEVIAAYEKRDDGYYHCRRGLL